ncbi:MAG: sel1 repeat family protein [Muribaculaceae bacterium]|nr:sel1 repeat family protein [Muribaculaceae bacterium]
MKRLLFLVLASLSIIATAQKLKVSSFKIQPEDLTARDQPRTDRDGQVAAILKVCVLDKITKAEGTVLGEIVNQGVEKWVYVTDNTKKIRLHFENHFPLMIVFDDYNYPSAQEKMVYEVILEEDNGSPTSTPTPTAIPTPSTASTQTSAPTPTPGITTQSISQILAEGKKYYNNREYVKAMEFFRRIDEDIIDDNEAQFYIGNLYFWGEGVAQDQQEAVKWYKRAGEQGHQWAQCILGGIYFDGLIVTQDYQEALNWYKKSANQGNSMAEVGVGNIYANGFGVTRDDKEAVKWYRKAANRGYAKGQFYLGVMYYYGFGVEKDFREAAKWYQKSAEKGFSNAQWALGDLYQYGFGVTKDYQEAVKWYRKSADQGDNMGQFLLGSMYEYGRGVNKDIPEAVKWYRKSAEQGLELAQDALERLGY